MSPVHSLLAALVATPFVLGVLATPADRPGDPVFRFQDPEIDESSGLVVRDGLFVTVNDSGDTARVFTVDPASGRTVGHTTWDAEPLDDEALAPAAHSTDVWVGDIGDNLADRDSITITRVPTGRGELSGAVASYELVYPDGAHDAETLLVDPVDGRVLVASKDFMGSLYAAPRHLTADGPNELRRIGDAPGIATDGAFFPDGKHLVVRDYDSATFYTYPGLRPVGEMRLPREQQGEGIAVAPDGQVYVCSEGVHSPVLRVTLPERIRNALSGSTDHPAPADPTADGTGTDAAPDDVRSLWPWALGGGALALLVVVLLRSLRPR